MEFTLNHSIGKNKTEKISLPNLKSHSLIPVKLKFKVSDIECIMYSQNNSIFKYGKAYFKLYDEIDLRDYRNTIADGFDLSLSFKNLSQKEITIGCSVVYDYCKGNIIYQNHFNTCGTVMHDVLKDIQDNGGNYLNKLIIDSDQVINSVTLEPQFKLTAATENTPESRLNELSNWANSITLSNETPGNTQYVIDFNEPELKKYVQYLKHYKLNIDLDKKEGEEIDIRIVGYGY